MYNDHVPGKRTNTIVFQTDEIGGMVNMEINCMGYRIEKPDGSNDVWVYRNKVHVMHLISSREETAQELAADVKEVLRILDIC